MGTINTFDGIPLSADIRAELPPEIVDYFGGIEVISSSSVSPSEQKQSYIIDAYGNIIPLGTTDNTALVYTYPVTGGDYYFLTGSAVYKYTVYEFVDSNGNVLSYYNNPNNTSYNKNYATVAKNKLVKAPDQAVNVYVAGYNITHSVVVPPSCVHVTDSKPKIVAFSENEYSAVAGIFDGAMTASTKVELTETETLPGYMINALGVVIALASQDTRYVVKKYDVSSGVAYSVTGTASANNCIYAFYDSDGVLIRKFNNEGNAGQYNTFTYAQDKLIVAPYQAKTLAVAGFDETAPTVESTSGLGKWSGYKWAAMGDSLTDYNTRALRRYYDYIAEQTGINVVELGVSGTGYMKEYNGGLPFWQRVDTIPTDSDVITIFGSGNDLSLTLGNATDTGTNTICGCVNTTISGIRERIVGAKIGIVTPTPWVSYPTTSPGNAMDNYANALVEICTLQGIPCLDLYHQSNMLPWDEDFRRLYYSRDGGNGVHPDENGHRLFIAPQFKAFLARFLM